VRVWGGCVCVGGWVGGWDAVRRVLRVWTVLVDTRAILRDAVAYTASRAIARRSRRLLLARWLHAWACAVSLGQRLVAFVQRSSAAAKGWAAWRARVALRLYWREHAAAVTAAVTVRGCARL
jgi:hypothetical protein